eukprot:UN16582
MCVCVCCFVCLFRFVFCITNKRRLKLNGFLCHC